MNERRNINHKKYVRAGQVVVVRAISPVPGGVGPLTIACLFENLFEAYRRQGGK